MSSPPAGIVLSNLGTPDAPTPRAVRRYLAEFLSDRRVVDLPRIPWWLLLHGVILRVRPRRAAQRYRQIWLPEGSPLLTISQRQATALQSELQKRGGIAIPVVVGMRYGRPSIASALVRLREMGVQRVLLFPLYPQYSSTTTASAFDALAESLRRVRWLPELRMIRHYPEEPGYLQALARCLDEARRRWGEPQRWLFSFHSIPAHYEREGDPYAQECHATARRVAELAGLPEGSWQVAFQSRFGRRRWIQPFTKALLREWASTGVRSVQVICPGFAADCLETLEEIARECRQVFLNAGGAMYHYIPALNDRPDHIAVLADLAMRHLSGWLPDRGDMG